MRKIKTITLRLEDDLHKEFKLYSVKNNKNMQDILVSLIKAELQQADNEKEVKK